MIRRMGRLFLFYSFWVFVAGCSDRIGVAKFEHPTLVEVQNIVPLPGPAPRRVTPGVLEIPPASVALPGEFAIRTLKDKYLTAMNGGGRATNPIVVTLATTAGPWEKFRLAVHSGSLAHDKTFQTAGGNYLTAVNGGGLTGEALHTDATQAKDWEKFKLVALRRALDVWNSPYYAIQTIKGNYLTAVGGGGRYPNGIHTDATQARDWELFHIVKCGDLGSGYDYGIMAANGDYLQARDARGQYKGSIWPGAATPFKLIRQGDGTYALQTANGINYVTALGGGGKVQKYAELTVGVSAFTTIFHTDATLVQGWEKFRFVDQGNCTYAIQTASGFHLGIYKDPSGIMALTTRRSGVSSENETFKLIVYGLASPDVLQ